MCEVLHQAHWILNYRFYYYSGMLRPTDQGKIAIEKIVCYSQVPRRVGHRQCHGRRQGKHRDPEAEGGRGKRGQKPLLWFPQETIGKVGVGRFRIGQSEYFQQL